MLTKSPGNHWPAGNDFGYCLWMADFHAASGTRPCCSNGRSTWVSRPNPNACRSRWICSTGGAGGGEYLRRYSDPIGEKNVSQESYRAWAREIDPKFAVVQLWNTSCRGSSGTAQEGGHG